VLEAEEVPVLEEPLLEELLFPPQPASMVSRRAADRALARILFMFTTPFHSGIKRFTDCLPCKNTCTQDMMALYLVTQKKAIWNADYF